MIDIAKKMSVFDIYILSGGFKPVIEVFCEMHKIPVKKIIATDFSDEDIVTIYNKTRFA